MLSCIKLNFLVPLVNCGDIRNVDNFGNFGIVGKVSNVGAVGRLW